MTLDTLDEAWQVLTHREKVVLKQRFGLNGDEPATLKQIGIGLGLSNTTIRSIISKAFFKLRRADRQIQGDSPVITATPKPKPVPKPVKKRRARKPKPVVPPLIRHSDAERIDWMEEAIKHQNLYIDYSQFRAWTLKLKELRVEENSLRDLLDRAMMAEHI